jgi:hypothetical protein
VARRGAIADAGESQCWRFAGRPGHRLRITLSVTTGALAPRVDLLWPDGSARCGVGPRRSTCTLDAEGSYTLLIRDAAGPGIGGYVLGILRLEEPTACNWEPYGILATGGLIRDPGDVGCRRFDGTAGDRVRVRTLVTSGSPRPRTEIVGPDGTTRCVAVDRERSECTVQQTGFFAILVEDDAGTATGSYRLALQRLNEPAGCQTLPSGIGVEEGTWTGSIATPGETDCWRLDRDAWDHLRVRLLPTGGAWQPAAEVLRPDGTTRCPLDGSDDFTCVLDRDGVHTILVSDGGGLGTGDYELTLRPRP